MGERDDKTALRSRHKSVQMTQETASLRLRANTARRAGRNVRFALFATADVHSGTGRSLPYLLLTQCEPGLGWKQLQKGRSPEVQPQA